MKFRKFKDWSLFKKIAMISIVTIVLLVGSISLFVIPVIEKNIMNERQAGLENVINLSYSLMEKYNLEVEKGEISKKEALAAVTANIKALRYGVDQSEYVFIVKSADCSIVMHPVKPSLDGKNVSETRDKKGKRLFAEMVDVCKKQSHGFVDYYWPKPGLDEPVPKLSYVKLFEPWDLIAGTGVYIDDVEAKMGAIKTKIYSIILLTIIISLALTLLYCQKDFE